MFFLHYLLMTVNVEHQETQSNRLKTIRLKTYPHFLWIKLLITSGLSSVAAIFMHYAVI